MRYIKKFKLFENKVYKKVTDVKKYFIDDMSSANIYYLFRVDNADLYTGTLNITKLYTYYLDGGLGLRVFDEEEQKDENYSLSLVDLTIMFDSDDFEEVLEEFMLLVDVKKYNL
jgi:hypothetical protein